MSPSRSEFERYFSNLISRLAESIKGRENSHKPIAPDRLDNREVAISLRRVPINTADGMFDFSFEIHADCPCNAINEFLQKVTLENITLAKGPKGGTVLGVNHEPIKGFYAYKK